MNKNAPAAVVDSGATSTWGVVGEPLILTGKKSNKHFQLPT